MGWRIPIWEVKIISNNTFGILEQLHLNLNSVHNIMNCEKTLR
uniref:Uncharacterized protein n=1 Tax=Rhizophora mucronata TaxID=61149 RepID=A0A2P2IQ15_RHIMU